MSTSRPRRADRPLTQAQVADALRVLDVLAIGSADLISVIAPELPPDARDTNALLALVAMRIHGPLRPAQISQRTGLTSGGTTRLIDRLEAQGLVERVYGRVPGDRRGATVTLTETGDAVLTRGADAIRSSSPAIARMAASLGTFLATVDNEGGHRRS